jgi:hypothetical protein
MRGRAGALAVEDTEAIVYRMAYGHARNRLEKHIAPRSAGRDDDDLVRRLVAEVTDQMGDAASGALEAIRHGVEDAAEGRHPAW